MKILWCITGGGHMLGETCGTLEELSRGHEITIAFTRAGREVVKGYGCLKRIEKSASKVVYEEEQGYSSPLACSLGQYGLIVVCPCTANSIAKISHGIADSLASNIAAQSLKTGRRLVLMPTDVDVNVETTIPSGKKVKLKCRKTDLENVERLEAENVAIIRNPSEVKKHMQNVD